MGTTIRWLHLTDLHVGMTDQDWLWPKVGSKFRDDLKKIYDTAGPWDLVLFTGDLVQKGTEYAELDTIFDEIWSWFADLGCDPKLLTVPGNHDLQWRDAKDPVVKHLYRWEADLDVREGFWNPADGQYRKPVNDAFAAYDAWWRDMRRRPDGVQPGFLPGDFSYTFVKDGFRLGIVGLNSASLQLTEKRGRRPFTGRMVLHPCQFNAACGGNGVKWAESHHACFLMTHHPPEWLDKESQEWLHGEIHESFQLHLCGHNHKTDVLQELAGGGEHAPLRWLGRSLFGLEKSSLGKLDRSHGYVAGELRLSDDFHGEIQFMPRERREQGKTWSLVPDLNVKLPDANHRTRPFPVQVRPVPIPSSTERPEGTLHASHGQVPVSPTMKASSNMVDSQEQLPSNPPLVFISYSHDSPEHAQQVLQLSERLRSDGIDAHIDQYTPWPEEGWPRWMEEKLRDARFVLMVCTETYLRRVTSQEEPDAGRGVCWEANLVYNDLYHRKIKSSKYVPVVFSSDNAQHIPPVLVGHANFCLDADDGYWQLYRLLTGQPAVRPGALGQVKKLSLKKLSPLPPLASKDYPSQIDLQADAGMPVGTSGRIEAPDAIPDAPASPTDAPASDATAPADSSEPSPRDESGAVETEPSPKPNPKAAFIAHELVQVICDQLESDTEASRSLRNALVQHVAGQTEEDPKADVDFFVQALREKLSEVMSVLRMWLDANQRIEGVEEVRRLVDAVATAGFDADWVQTLIDELEARHLHVPIETDLYLCEVIFTALYRKPATWIHERAIDHDAIRAIEPPSIKPKLRRREIRRRLVETHFKDRISRGVGESKDAYERRLDDWARDDLPGVLESEREDQKPWFVLFLETVEALKQDMEIDPELWSHIVKLERSRTAGRFVCDRPKLQNRLRVMHQRLDKLDAQARKGPQ